jgi:hypothetical protein
MAIQKDFTSKHGVSAPSAYHRVETVFVDQIRTGYNSTACVKVYNSQVDRAAGRAPLARMEFTFETSTAADALNPVAQAYEALKEMDDVIGVNYTSGAIDV